ncbi:hypothetical protein CA13_25790 [Planctomycetes bacterium CA13]|uniref:N-acetyltransferase domain-containing protein n=1 Tax=Novipirellula herctigrandis TaxID=2527986 RepID=A0A5C5Z2Q1_9BACT|nr:hypothetical protein CA13_25790 [Planctomycetes bacterium CA13]
MESSKSFRLRASKTAVNDTSSSSKRRKVLFTRLDLLHYRTARSRDDFERAFRLLQQRYTDAGLASPADSALRIMPYHLSHVSQVFLAVKFNRVVGTVTLVWDAAAKLPLAADYPEAIDSLCYRSERVGEITSLAIEPSEAPRGEIFAQLNRLMGHFAMEKGLDYLTAVVHPRHAKFYRKALGAEQISNIARCSTVRGNAGVVVAIKVNDSLRYRSRLPNFACEAKFTSKDITAHPISDQDRQYFAAQTYTAFKQAG